MIGNVESCLRQTRGIRDLGWLTAEERNRVRRLEAAGTGVNAGVLEVLDRRHVCAALSDADFRHASAPCVRWVADGIVIGEEVVDPGRREALLRSPAVGCLGNGFLLYFDRMKAARGKQPVFVYESLPFAEVADCDNVRQVVSCSPGSGVDLYVKRRFAWPEHDAALGTILIGFETSDVPMEETPPPHR